MSVSTYPYESTSSEWGNLEFNQLVIIHLNTATLICDKLQLFDPCLHILSLARQSMGPAHIEVLFENESHSSQVLCLCFLRSWKCLRRGWSRWLWSLEENLPSSSSKTVSWRMQWRERSWRISWHRDRWRSLVNHALCCFLTECTIQFHLYSTKS